MAEANNQPPTTGIFVLLLGCTFTVAAGYGVVLPILPYFLKSLPDHGAHISLSRHTGMLTGAYMLAPVLFAPVRRHVSDRMGRRRIRLVGLSGFILSLFLMGMAGSPWLAHAARGVSGFFAAAILPVALAFIGGITQAEQRARQFAWINTSILLGFLTGPALSGALTHIGVVIPCGMPMPSGVFSLPFFTVGFMGLALWLPIYCLLPEARPGGRSSEASPESNRMMRSIRPLLFLTLLGTFGMGGFEVGLTLQGQQSSNFLPVRSA